MNHKIEQQIGETYNHIKPYLKRQDELKELCANCEKYCGGEHDYEECRNNMCFKMFLAFEYLNWNNSFEN